MSEAVADQIKEDIKANDILIYMKGTPAAPQCGFSAATSQLISSFGLPFETRDVIANPELRDAVPKISQWPTFPQVFVKGKLVGGCDIIHEIHERGELDDVLKGVKKD